MTQKNKSSGHATIVKDPLAKNANTWDGQTNGPPCMVCNVNLALGHRYYTLVEATEKTEAVVVHYCCYEGPENGEEAKTRNGS